MGSQQKPDRVLVVTHPLREDVAELAVPVEQSLDGREVEAHLAQAADELESGEVGLGVAAVAGVRPARRRQQPGVRVEPDRLDRDARKLREAADGVRRLSGLHLQ